MSAEATGRYTLCMAAFIWILGTSGKTVRWHKFLRDEDGKIITEESDYLEMDRVTVFESREAAREMAEKAGLKGWRYFRL